MSDLKGVHYDAFISYRHSELDAFVAKNIHTKLESFRLPKSLRGKTKNGKTKIERVFRDVDELPLSENLSEPINAALANSDFLITICTPRYLESRWCMKEIEVFLQTHDRDHILVVLAEDEPQNSFPRILTYEEVISTDENGNTVKTEKELEPLAADTRGSNKKEILKAMDIAVIKICAAIFGLNYDDLKQRHREQKIKRMAAVLGSIGAAVLLFAVFATVMLIRIGRQNVVISEQNAELENKNALISEQYAELHDKYVGTVADNADSLYSMGRSFDAVYEARNVLPDSEDDAPNAAALRVLYDALNIYTVPEKYAPDRIYEGGSEMLEFSVTQDDRYIMINNDEEIRIFDTESGLLVRTINRSSEPGEYLDDDIFSAGFCGTEGLVVIDGEDVYYTEISSDTKKSIEGIKGYTDFFSSPDGKMMFCFSDCILYAFDSKGELLYEIDAKELFGIEDGYIFEMDFDGENFLCNINTNEDYCMIIAETESGRVIASASENGGAAMEIQDGELFTSVVSYDEKEEKNCTTVSCTDYLIGENVWNISIEGYTPYNIEAAGECVYINGLDLVTIIDRYTGSVVETIPSEGEITCSWTDGDIYYYLTSKGKLFSNDGDFNGWDETDRFFARKPENETYWAQIRGNSLYLVGYRNNFVVRYSEKMAEGAESVLYEYECSSEQDESAYEEINNAFGSGGALPDYAKYSEDKKYIAALYPDNIIKIYERDTMEVQGAFMIDSWDFCITKFYRSEMMGCYVIDTDYSGYLLNDKFEVFCRMQARIVDEKNGELILEPYSSIGDYYSVPYVSYEELLGRADEYLDGYEPSDDVRLKYNMQ
ncbi:MAG: toll/interleukin-1 receptor domain-containing protein [Lachnospiraceae bacterium]|nr:toll/interleukin-1 receptor domain-containing protein [Lachnospiraceae bacterium]